MVSGLEFVPFEQLPAYPVQWGHRHVIGHGSDTGEAP